MSPEIDRLEPAWRALAERRGNGFLTPEWYRCWLRHYGSEVIPFVPALHDAEGRLVGVLPLAMQRSGRPRACRIAGANLGDHFHPLSEPADESAVGAAIGEQLADRAESWSVLGLDRVEVRSGWVDALSDRVGGRVKTLARPASVLPYIDLAQHSDWDAYLGSRSSNLRSQLRKFPRRAARQHSLMIRQTASPDQLEADMTTFFRLHDLRMAEHGGSTLSTPRAQAFHRDFARAALERGWLRLWTLELDGQPAASWYGWRVGDRYAFYNQGLDPEWARISPGTVLLAKVLETALEEGASEFDFLLGDETFKFRFADQTREVRDVTIARRFPSAAAAIASAEHGLRAAGRLVPPEARRRLGLTRLARRSALRGRGR